MKKHLDSSILQTKTATTLIELLTRAREVTKDNTRNAKVVNKDIDFVLDCYKRVFDTAKKKRKTHVLSDNNFTGIYKVNL